MRLLSLLLLTACTAARAPAGVSAAADGLAVCSSRDVDSYRDRLSLRQSRAVRSALADGYERSVAEWQVCAWSAGLEGWTAPPVDDALSVLTRDALREPRGSRGRIVAVERMAALSPLAAALFALDELVILDFIGDADPGLRADLVAATLGAWGCPDSREWIPGPDGGEIGFCAGATDAVTLGVEGLNRLRAMAEPALDLEASAYAGLSTHVHQRWVAAERVWIPLPVTPAASGVVLPRVVGGNPVAPGAGWALHVEPGHAAWSKRAAYRITRAGIELADTSQVDAGPLPPVEGAVVFASASLSMGELRELLREAGVVAPTLVVRGEGQLVELPLRMRLDAEGAEDAPMLGPETPDAGALRGRLRAYLDSDEPVPVLALHPQLPFGEAAAAVGALSDVAGKPMGGVVIGEASP